MRFGLLCTGVWLHSADSLVTATTAPAIVAELGGLDYINWTVLLYQVGAITAGAATAMWCGRIGVKPLFVLAAAIYGCGCLLAALAPTITGVLTARLVQGLGGGILLSLSYLAVHEWFNAALWPTLFGIVASIWAAGSLLGPLIGGLFANHQLWRGAFWLFAAQGLGLALLAHVLLPAEPRKPQAAASWPVVTLALLIGATLLIAEAGVLRGVGAISSAVAGAVLLYLAAQRDRDAAARLLPRQLLDWRHPVGAGLLMVLALATSATGFWAYGPLLLKALFGTNPLIAGYILALEALTWSIGTMAVSRVGARHDRLLIRGGVSIVALGAGGYALVVPAGSFAGMILCSALQGLGFGVCWPAVIQRIVRYSDEAEKSLASTSASSVQRTGYAVGTAAAGIAANLSGLADGMSAAAAKTAGFWVFAAFIPTLLLALWFAWRFTRR